MKPQTLPMQMLQMRANKKAIMPKLLLIEDDKTMLSLLRTLLTIEGFDIAISENDNTLDEYLGKIKLEKPTLILLDVHLRFINGIELLRAIRKDEALKATLVIMSSGMDVRTQCEEEGADDFILKPYMPDELILKINQCIN